MEANLESFRDGLAKLISGNVSYIVYEDYQFQLISDEHSLYSELFAIHKEPSKCILVSGQMELYHNTQSDDVNRNQKDDEQHSQFIGSPLKLQDFQGDLHIRSHSESPTKQTSGTIVKPVTAKKAKRILSLCNLVCQRMTCISDLLRIWVACDGSDQAGTAFVSSYIKCHSTQSNLILVDSLSVNTQGPLTDKRKLPTVASILAKQHSDRRHQLNYSARYTLFGQKTGLDKSLSTSSSQGFVEVALRWDKQSTLLEEPPLDSNAVMCVSVMSMDPRSAAHYMYTELVALQGFVGGLSNGSVNWAVWDSDFKVEDRVKKLVEDLKLGDAREKSESAVDENYVHLEHLMLTKRLDYDFTELLWNILKDCSTYQELVDSFMYIFSRLETKELQPMVYKSNKSTLAQLVRESYSNTIVTDCFLKNEKPLEMLVEIGIDKLIRDYLHVFLGSNLATPNHLEYYLSNRDKETMAEKVHRLEKLHHVLETVLVLEQYLRLPRQTLCRTLWQALQYYEEHDVDNHDVFNVPIQTTYVSALLKRNRPTDWQAIAVCSVLEQDVRTTIHLSSYPPFKHVVCGEQCDVEVDSEKAISYYMTITSEVIHALN